MKVNVTEGDLALGVQVIVEKHGAKARYALRLEPIGNVPPAEREKAYYRQLEESGEAA